VQAKSRANHQKASAPEELAQRSYPTVQCDFYTVSGNLNVLIMVDCWTKFVAVEPLRNKLQSVVGAAVAKFLGELGYYDKVELAYDNEPVLAAGMRVAQTIRAAQGLETILQPGQMYGKARTSLAERSIQTVRAQGKCLMLHLEEKMRVKFAPEHPLRGWSVIHGAWLLNRFHIASSIGTTAFMSLRGRPYKGRVCAFGEEVFALDPLQAKYSSQWRRGIWLTKDSTDMDIVAVTPTEIIRSRAVRKVSEHWNAELAVALEVGPWDMRRGVNTEVKPAQAPQTPLPLLHVPVGGVEPELDEDERAVRDYARRHPQEDAEDDGENGQPERSEEGGAVEDASAGIQGQVDMEDVNLQVSRDKRLPEDIKLPIPVRQRVADVEANKRVQQQGDGAPAKMVKFDPDSEIAEPSPKQPRTTLYSPTYAGNLASSPATSSTMTRNVRRVVDELESYDEDEVECNVAEEPWDWEFCENPLKLDDDGVEISEAEQRSRGFHDEGAGPPNVTPEELSFLDREAMQMELDRLKALDVIGTVNPGLDVEQCVKLDTRLVRDWRFREGKWRRRARLVAREFRAGDCSSTETFSPTTPLVIVKMMIVLGLVHDLAVASLDVGDAFLQVPQSTMVLIEIPTWAVGAEGNGDQGQFWILKRCLPGQRAAASEWNKFFVEVCERYGYETFQGTIFKHRTERAYISVHIDDLLVIGSKEHIRDFHERLSKELKLKIEGPLQCGDEGSIFYLKREIQFAEDGIYIAPSSRYIPKLMEMLNIQDRRGKGVPHHGCLQIFDPETTGPDEFLGSEEAKLFRSALGICIYVSQERCDIQHSVRVLATYMSKPTKMAMSGIKKLACYLMFSKDMKMHYKKAELYHTTWQRWHGGSRKMDTKPYMLELYSDSDWASCKVSRRSTSAGLIFLNSCLIHSHSRSQTSISLSSMEAEILSATSLLTEGIYVKQVLQFLVNDNGGLGNQSRVAMQLRLDSTSAQAFFTRLGPGKAKHLSTRLLWTQQAMRRQWFEVLRVSTRENPADLNTKALARERREFLMKRIGLVSEVFGEDEEIPYQGKKKQLVRLLVNMIMASNLQGCEESVFSWTSSTDSGKPDEMECQRMRWSLQLAMVVILCMTMVMLRIFYKLTEKMEIIENYKQTIQQIREVARFGNQQEVPHCEESGDDHFSEHHGEEEEEPSPDEPVEDENVEVPREAIGAEYATGGSTEIDAEVPGLRRRVLRLDGAHGAAEGDEPEVPGGADADDEDESFELEESPTTRYRRYQQSTMDEVSDPDEWANIHYGFGTRDDSEHGDDLASRRSRSRNEEESDNVPRPKTMPRPLAKQVGRRIAMDKAMEMRAEKEMNATEPSSSSANISGIVNDGNYYLSSVPMATYFNISPVPRAPDALDDYRWDQIMQGIRPEHVVVVNCADLANYIPLEQDPILQRRHQRLLRNLQNLLVKFQSGNAELWIEAGEQVRSWLENERFVDFFEEQETEFGDDAEEGEEESRTDDDPSQPGDGDRDHDGSGHGEPDYDYDIDEEYRDDGGGEHRPEVAGRPTTSRPSSSYRR
jgi:hypothetical protein